MPAMIELAPSIAIASVSGLSSTVLEGLGSRRQPETPLDLWQVTHEVLTQATPADLAAAIRADLKALRS